jgi:hypothetical protein
MLPATSFALHDRIGANRTLLRLPPGCKTAPSGDDLMVMVVGGPNARTDDHVNPFEEFHYRPRRRIAASLAAKSSGHGATLVRWIGGRTRPLSKNGDVRCVHCPRRARRFH